MNDALQRASVTLLIHGDDLVPEELTAILGVQPEIGVRKGETFMSGGWPGTTVTASTGKWIVGTGNREPPNIDEQIAELLGSLPEGADTWNDLTTRFDCYVTVGAWFTDGSWTGGLVLGPKTLRILAERGLAIDFDMYGPGAPD
jgi:hypothetical protein